MKYGYARVSSVGQDLTAQLESLKSAGCENIRQEKISEKSVQGRDELNTLLGSLREGDELVVTRVDGLARSIRDLQNIVHDLNEKGIALRATDQPIDTTTSAGKCFLDMLGVFAEFETNLRKERQMEGIAKAKEKGVYKGRKPSIDINKVRELRESGMGATAISRELGIGRASVYRVLERKGIRETRMTKETDFEYLIGLVKNLYANNPI